MHKSICLSFDLSSIRDLYRFQQLSHYLDFAGQVSQQGPYTTWWLNFSDITVCNLTKCQMFLNLYLNIWRCSCLTSCYKIVVCNIFLDRHEINAMFIKRCYIHKSVDYFSFNLLISQQSSLDMLFLFKSFDMSCYFLFFKVFFMNILYFSFVSLQTAYLGCKF